MGAARFVAGETLDVVRRRAAQAQRRRPVREHDAPRRGDPERRGRGRGHRRVRADHRAARRREAEGERRSQAHAPRPRPSTRRLAYANVERLVARAGELGTFLRIDMEQSEYVDATLRHLRATARRRPRQPSAPCSSRTSTARRTTSSACCRATPNLRIVKGAYLEPASIAYPEKADVDRAYVELVERGLREGAYIAVATHDEAIIRQRAGVHGARRNRRATASSSRCSTACGPGCSARSRLRATRCSSRRRSAPTGTRTSCAGSPSDRRISGSSCKNLVRR